MLCDPHCDRVRTAEYAPGDPRRILERRHGLAEIIQRGAVVLVESFRISPPYFERDSMALSENASCHGNRFAQQRFGFFKEPLITKGRRIDRLQFRVS